MTSRATDPTPPHAAVTLHVHVAGWPAAEPVPAVAEALGRLLGATAGATAGATTGATTATGQALVLPEPGPFVAVVDPGLDPEGDEADVRAAAISGGLARAVVLAATAPSGLLRLALYRDGRLVDEHELDPAGAEPGFPDPTTAAWQPHLWRDVLPEGTPVERLRAAGSEDVPADAAAALRRFADVFGWDAGVGTGSLSPFASPPPGAVTVRLPGTARADRAPAPVTKADPGSRPGPPRLAVAGTTGGWEGSVGGEVAVTVRLRNDGGAGNGLTVQAWGHALDNGLVLPVRASAAGTTSTFGNRPHPRTGQPVPRAELAGLAVPAGGPRTGPPPGPGEPAPADLEVEVAFKVLAAGWTQAFLAFIPDDRGGGQAATAVMLSLLAPRP